MHCPYLYITCRYCTRVPIHTFNSNILYRHHWGPHTLGRKPGRETFFAPHFAPHFAQAKIRLLPDRRESIDLALAIEDSGAAALCVHGRTVEQRPRLGGKVEDSRMAPGNHQGSVIHAVTCGSLCLATTILIQNI